jgi:hypothetical protein
MSRMIVTAVIGVMLLSGGAAAQCTSFPTTLANGATADANQVMGDLNYLAGCLAPQVNPSLSGNVVIGTTATIANQQAAMQFSNSVAPSPGIANQIGLWHASTGVAAYGFGVSPSLLNIVSAGGTAFYNAGSDVLHITNAGLVGIGDSTPDGTLTVKSGNGDVVLNGTAANGLSAAGSIIFEDNGAYAWHLFAWHSDGNFYLQGVAGTNMHVVAGTNSWSASSDVRLKTNIETLPVLDRLGGYRAVSFDWKASGKHDIGVIAQELYKVFPEVVNKGSDGGALSGAEDKGTWSVQYDRLGALALEAAKELKVENDKLREVNRTQAQALQALEARMARLEKAVKPQVTVAARQ